jgi:hypothetical protein
LGLTNDHSATENDIDDWTSGYVADLDYTYGYYSELNPLNAELVLLNAGLKPPRILNACELGFGQGVSVNVHAAASHVQWWGTDFNPAQAGFAQELTASSGSKACLFDASFEEFCARPDLPEMDYVALHGIWSWVSDANRKVIVDFLRRKLKVGGVLYVGYNSLPGWAAMMPIRDVFVQHADLMGTPAEGRVARIDAALDFTQNLLGINPAFIQSNPGVTDRVRRARDTDRAYVAHEYFNRDWQPMSFSAMSQWLEPAKLSYAGSGYFLEAMDSLNLSPEQQAFLAAIPNAGFRQTVRDLCVNRGFRKDYWVKGARALTPAERTEGLRRLNFVLAVRPESVTYTASGLQGQFNLDERLYRPLVDILADQQPRPLEHLERALSSRDISLSLLLQAMIILMGKGSAYMAQQTPVADQLKSRTARLNHELLRASSMGKGISVLASPATGGGIPVAQFHQLFLMSARTGKTDPQHWAHDAWTMLQAQGHCVVKGGIVLETDQQNLAELMAGALEFRDNSLPILRALGI